MMPTETENQENKSSNNYGSLTAFFAGSLTSAALIAGTCYIKPELCASLLNIAAKESTALVISTSNTELTAAWEGLKGTMIKFAQVQLIPTQEQLLSSAITVVTSNIIDITSSDAWAVNINEIDKVIEGSDRHNFGPDQTLDEIDMSSFKSDSNSGSGSGSGRSTPDTVKSEQDDIPGDSLGEDESGTIDTRTQTPSVGYQNEGSELDLENIVVDQAQESTSGTTQRFTEYQEESDSSRSNTPVNTPVRDDTIDGTNDGRTARANSPVDSDLVVEESVPIEVEHGDNTVDEFQQAPVEMSGQILSVDAADA